MSGTLGDLMLAGARYLTGEQPLLQAQAAEASSRVPLNQAQAAEAQAKVPYWGAETGFIGANTTKAQIDNAMQQILLNRMRGLGGSGGNQGGGGTTYPREPGTAPPPADQSQTSYQPPSTAPSNPPPPPVVPTIRAPDPSTSTTGTAMRFPPGSTQLAMNDTGTMSDVGPGLYSTTSEPVPPGAMPPTGAVQLAQAGQPPGTARPGVPPAVGAPVPPAQSPQAAALQAQGGPYNPNGTSDAGAFVPGVGAVPKDMEFDYLWGLKSGQNPVELKRGITAQRNQYLATQAGLATSPADWDARVEQLWRDGWLTHHDANNMKGRFDGRAGIITALTTPAEQTQTQTTRFGQGAELGPRGNVQVSPTAQQAEEGLAAARARPGPAAWTTIDVPDPEHPGQVIPKHIPPGTSQQFLQEFLRQNPGSVVRPQSSNAPAGGGGPSTSSVTNNNPGNLTFANQPGASRVPGSQFASFPDAATGVAATADQLAMNQDQHNMQSVTDQVHRWVGPNDVRTKPKEVARYVADTAAALGVDPNARVDWHDPNVQAKFIQAQQAHETHGTLAQADVEKGVQMAAARRGTQYAGPGVPQDNTPAGAIVRGMVDRGANPVTLQTGRPDTDTTTPPPAQVAQAGAPSQYSISGAPRPSPATVAQRELERPFYDSDTAAVTTAQKAQTDFRQLEPTIRDMRDDAPKVGAGALSQWRMTAGNLLKLFVGTGTDTDAWLKDRGIDLSTVAGQQKFNKEALTLVQRNAQAMGVAHPGIGIASMISGSTPGLEMQPDAIKQILNMYLVTGQMANDYANQLNDRVTPYQQKYIGDFSMRYASQERAFNREWGTTDSPHSASTYRAAMQILNEKPAKEWGSGLTDAQFNEAREIALRTDPNLRLSKEQMFR